MGSMKRTGILTAALLAALTVSHGQEDVALPSAMREIASVSAKLKQAIESDSDEDSDRVRRGENRGTYPETGKEARSAAAAFKSVAEYFAKRQIDGAVKLAQQSETAANDLAAAAIAGDADKELLAMTALTAGCQNCHKTYREKLADGGFRIKQ
jgi:cytochrome c556